MAQGDFHCYDVFTHSLYACDAAPRAVPRAAPGRAAARRRQAARAAARLPTGGRRSTATRRSPREMTREILERLRFPTAVIRDVAHLVGAPHVQLPGGVVRRGRAAPHRPGRREDSSRTSSRCAGRTRSGMCRENARVLPAGPRRLRARESRRCCEAGKAFTRARAGGRRERHHGAAGPRRRARGRHILERAPAGGAGGPRAQRAGAAAGDRAEAVWRNDWDEPEGAAPRPLRGRASRLSPRGRSSTRATAGASAAGSAPAAPRLAPSCMAFQARRAASCSASFLFLPLPAPKTGRRSCTSIQKVGRGRARSSARPGTAGRSSCASARALEEGSCSPSRAGSRAPCRSRG